MGVCGIDCVELWRSEREEQHITIKVDTKNWLMRNLHVCLRKIMTQKRINDVYLSREIAMRR